LKREEGESIGWKWPMERMCGANVHVSEVRTPRRRVSMSEGKRKEVVSPNSDPLIRHCPG
jgi:hypothetical protein